MNYIDFFTILWYNNIAKQTKYTVSGCILFLGITIPFSSHTFVVEFDKMQIPYTMKVCIYPFCIIVCLATTGICVFVR